MKRTMHIFPFSHFSEKGMWILDFKGLHYETRPGFDPLVRQRISSLTGGTSTLPVLEDDDRVVGDTTEMALYLDRNYPGPALIPREGRERAECLVFEDWADNELGVHARSWLFGHALYDEPRAARRLLAQTPVPQSLMRLGWPLISTGMKWTLGVTRSTKSEAEPKVAEALQLLEFKLAHRAFLVGDHFTLADLTVCALSAPLAESPQWTRRFPKFFTWRSSICAAHGRRRSLTESLPSVDERRRRGVNGALRTSSPSDMRYKHPGTSVRQERESEVYPRAATV